MQIVATDSTEIDNESQSGIERRRGLRIHQQRPIKVYDAVSARYMGGQTEDISATGLRIEMPSWAPVCPGKLLNVHVGLSSAGEALANRRGMVPARVVWINRDLRQQNKLMA